MSEQIIAKVISVENVSKMYTNFTAYHIDENKGIKMIIFQELHVREGDIINCQATYDNGRYVIDGSILPYIEPSGDENSIIQCFCKVLKRGNQVCRKIYNNIKQLCKANEDVSSKMTFLADSWKQDNDQYIIQYFTDSINENEAKNLLNWWYQERNLRKLYLLGLTDLEINDAKMTCHEMYKVCSVNPYVIPSIPIEKCKEIMNMFGLFPSSSNIMCGRIIRFVFDHVKKRSSSCVNKNLIEMNFPEYQNYLKDLEKYYGLIQHPDGKIQLNSIYKIEKKVADFIISLMKENWVTPNTPLDQYVNGKIRHSANYTKNLNDEQKDAIQAALDYNICCITSGSGCGKCFYRGTRILLYNGTIKNVEDIQQGELLMGPDSKPRIVKSTCQGIDRMYRIVPTKGEGFICNEPHILTLKCNQDIFDIALDDYMKLNDTIKNNCYLFHVGVDFEEQKTSIDAYTYGTLIGSHEQIEYKYKTNSRNNLLSLFAGIIDTIGDYDGQRIVIKSQGHIDKDIMYVAHALGYLAYQVDDLIYVEGDIFIDIPVKTLRDQLIEHKAENSTSVRFDVEYFCEDDYFGFKLEESDGRFLLDSFMVVHNTTCIDQIAHNLDMRGEKYVICSFTGKAVARVKEVTGKKDSCYTIDRLIANANKLKGMVTIKHVIIDECSMVTTELFYRLIQAFPEITHIVLVGDVQQLCPINHGSLFNEIIKSRRVPVYYLNTSHRFYFTNNGDDGQIDGIMENAKAILDHKIGKFEFITSTEDQYVGNFQVLRGGIDKVANILKQLKKSKIDSKDISILCPYEAELGELNLIAQKIFTNDQEFAIDGKGRRFNVGDKIIHKINDYELGIYNGTEGKITAVTEKAIKVNFDNVGTVDFLLKSIYQEDPYHLLPSIKKKNYRNRMVDFVESGHLSKQEQDALRNTERLDVSFGITVDKSQGSEYGYVIFYVPERTHNNYKHVNKLRIYTAITRSKICCYVVGSKDDISQGVSYNPYCERFDMLAKILIENLPEFKPVNCIKDQEAEKMMEEYGFDEDDFFD